MNKLPIISVVIPVHNESDNIEWFYGELSDTLRKINLGYEIIYIDDGSTDDTDTIISKIAKADENIRYICLARNFGKEAATSAGLHVARGAAAIIIDGDGQHPPDKLPEMIKLWKSGYQHIVGIRASNEKAGVVKNTGSKLFYFLARRMGAAGLIPNSTDFRLVDRELIDTFKQFGEKKRMTRSLLDWSGYKTTSIKFDARDRTMGAPSYKFKSLLRLAINGYIGATLKPLYFIGLLGIIITLSSFLLLIFLLTSHFGFGDPFNLGVSGTAYIAIFVTMLVGLLMISQGVIAAYVANIQLEAQNRPLYIINKARSIRW